MRTAMLVFSILTTLSIGSNASAKSALKFSVRTDVNQRDYEKVALRGRYAMYLPRDQYKKSAFAPGKDGKQLLIGMRPSSGGRVFARVNLQGNRIYKSGRAIAHALNVRLSDYAEKSVVAYLPSRNPQDARPRYYRVIGPKSGKGPLLIERRPSQLTGGKPVEYSVLEF